MKTMMRGALVPALLLVVTCGPKGPVSEPRASESPSETFAREAEDWFQAYLASHPKYAAWLGFHEYDGQLPDISPAAFAAEIERQEGALALFEGIDLEELTPLQRIEHAVVVNTIRKELFQLEEIRAPWRNPRVYVRSLDLVNYVARDYRPRHERIRAVVRICEDSPEFLTQADENLEQAIPRPWLETGIMQVKGMIPFVREDLRVAMGEPEDPGLKADMEQGLETLATALETFLAALEGRLDAATEDWPLGEERFLRLLSETQGIDMDLETLEEMGRKDLERNLEAIEEAARLIDPDRSVHEVVAEVTADKPPADGVLAEAEKQAAEMRRFLLDKDLVSIPTDDVAEVRETPPFKRWNAAMLDSPGPFETRKLTAYYYISPPDPTWPEQVQQDYIPGRSDLLFITIHELWPGHFLHSLHEKRLDSRILKSFWAYTMGEGWAHYTEEMMWQAGVGDGDPTVHIGQLLNALLRNVRYMSAIGMHARGMTREESAQMFRDRAFQDEANATQQATRGTFDPLYLSYTLGKLMILELRDDWKKKQGEDYSLKAFHDAFLSYGTAPIPAIREAMLAD